MIERDGPDGGAGRPSPTGWHGGDQGVAIEARCRLRFRELSCSLSMPPQCGSRSSGRKWAAPRPVLANWSSSRSYETSSRRFSAGGDGRERVKALELASADHRRHAEILECQSVDLKHDASSLRSMVPSGRFPGSNGAWLAVQVLAHNLARLDRAHRSGRGGGDHRKTLRRRFFSLAGRLTRLRSPPALTLHLPQGWPWKTQFTSRPGSIAVALPLPALTATDGQQLDSRVRTRLPNAPPQSRTWPGPTIVTQAQVHGLGSPGAAAQHWPPGAARQDRHLDAPNDMVAKAASTGCSIVSGIELCCSKTVIADPHGPHPLAASGH